VAARLAPDMHAVAGAGHRARRRQVVGSAFQRRRGMARRSALRNQLEPRHVAVHAQPEPGQR
jgi:hypothetical protein